MHVCIRAVNVCARKCMYMHVSDFIEAVHRLDWSSMCPYSQHIRADTDTLLGTPYARICMYMHVFLSAFLAQIRAHTYGHCAVTVALPGAGLRTFAARSLRQVCRAAAQAQADRQIQSDQFCATNQRAAGAGNLDRHASAVPWQSW
jgi:hypothetical protein